MATINLNISGKRQAVDVDPKKLLAEKSDSVKIIEEVSDQVLARSIVKGKASGYANTNRVLKKLLLK